MIQEAAPPVRTGDLGARLEDRKLARASEKARDPKAELAQLRELAQGFESVFLHMLMKAMRATVKKSEVLSGGRGEEIFTDLFDTHVAESGARRGGGIGIAEMIVKRYSRHVLAGAGAGTNGSTGSAVRP